MEYREALAQVIDGWNADPILDEWLFENFRQKIVGGMTSAEAFEAIEVTISMLLNEEDESTSTEIVQTIISLAGQSAKTEIPKGLIIHGDEILNRFRRFGDYAKNKLRELLRYYRMPLPV
jgi:hypothetical protein